MTWGEFLMKKFSVDRYTFSVNTSHHDSGRRLREVEFYFKLKKKTAGSTDGDLTCHVFNLEVAVAHLVTRDPSEIVFSH